MAIFFHGVVHVGRRLSHRSGADGECVGKCGEGRESLGRAGRHGRKTVSRGAIPTACQTRAQSIGLRLFQLPSHWIRSVMNSESISSAETRMVISYLPGVLRAK